MSVINQMLRDLDQRQSSDRQTMTPRPMYSRSNNLWLWPILGLVAAILAAIAVWFYLIPNWNGFTSQSTAQEHGIDAPMPVTDVAHDQSDSVDHPSTVTTANPAIKPSVAATPESEKVTQQSVDRPSDKSVTSQNETDLVDNSQQSLGSITETEVADKPMQPGPEALKQAEIEKPAEQISPRLIKLSPQQVRRNDAESAYDALLQQTNRRPNVSQLQAIIAMDASFHRPRLAYLKLLMEKEPAAFEHEATKAIADWPEITQYRQMLGRYWVMEQPKRAYELLLQSVPDIKQAPDYHGLMAYAAKQKGDLVLAGRQYQLLLRHYPERADWWLALALVQEQLRQPGLALESYRQSLDFPGLGADVRQYAQQRIKALQGF